MGSKWIFLGVGGNWVVWEAGYFGISRSVEVVIYSLTLLTDKKFMDWLNAL
jgi:hypothetical protein